MKLKDLKIEDLELMSYTDIAYMLLKEGKVTMNTKDVFKKICELLDYTDDEYASKIGDFYTSLTIDKRFVLLDNNEWDVRDNHSIKVEMDDDEEEEEEVIEEEEEVIEEEVESDDTIYDDENDITDDDDDMEDLSIITDEEEE